MTRSLNIDCIAATPTCAAAAQVCAPGLQFLQTSRRQFLMGGAGLGLAALGVPQLLAGCDTQTENDTAVVPKEFEQTLFVNLSHEEHLGRTYTLTAGGRRYVLTPVPEAPEVLQQARTQNAFLRGVPDHHITHHVANAVFAAGSVTLAYISFDLQTDAGTWAMSSMQTILPPSAAVRAYASARSRTPVGPLPLSAKRSFYDVAGAQSEQDLQDERVLLDPRSHAASVVSSHPDLFGLDPGAAHIVFSNHIEPGIDVLNLAARLSASGPAMPQQAHGQENEAGWGTLRPVIGDDGHPLKNTRGKHAGRIQYQPSLRSELHALARGGMNAAALAVRNDTLLGADITGITPGDAANAALAGALWMRHDGLTRIDQSAGSDYADADATMTLKQLNPQALYLVKASSSLSDASVHVALSFVNFYLEFRGIFMQFLDGSRVLKLKEIAEYNQGRIVARHSNLQDTETDMFVGMVGPVYTVFGIPVAPGFAQPAFNMPEHATSVRIFSSGLSFQRGNSHPETVLQGAIMTGIFNYGMTALLAAAGAAPAINDLWRKVVVPLAQTLALEIVTVINSGLNPNGDSSLIGQLLTPAYWIGQSLVLAKMIITKGVGMATTALVNWVVESIGMAVAEDSIPIAGQIAMGISIVTGAINIAETTAELATTPWTFVDELVFTHDLSVTLQPAHNDFPAAANRYTVTATFDDGTPHVQSFELDGSVRQTLPPVEFRSVPLGGGVNVLVAFIQEATVPGMPDVLLGNGATGLVANIVGAAPTIRIEELAFPIGAGTRYRHARKTTLDAQGRHQWIQGSAPTLNAAISKCGDPTAVCPRSISLRQATGDGQEYLGYSWQSQNHDPSRAPSCQGGGAGQLDQVAALATDPTIGSSVLAFASSACGIASPGVRVAYSLIGSGPKNFYLDTSDATTPTVRQINLDPAPAITPPGSGQAWGVLNYPSDALLLHPAGHLVSVSIANHRIETLKLPLAAMSDADAQVKLLAQLKSGKGSRPGLMDTPVAAAISADGVILVLESGNNRIQAFDLGANPVRHFTRQSGQGSSAYSLTLGGTDPVGGWQYLDLAVEYTGYVYVLSYNENTFDYRMDIYHPKQVGTQPIATTQKINAARLTVDLWRSVYTLNYEVLQLPSGAPAGLTEPSVSLWTPCNVGQTC